MEQKRLGLSRALRQPMIISNEFWRSSCKANRLMITVGQSNQPKRRSWTCGLRQLVACIRGESTTLDQSLVSAVVLLDSLVLILRHIARLTWMSLSNCRSCIFKKGLQGKKRQRKGRKKIGEGMKRKGGGRKK